MTSGSGLGFGPFRLDLHTKQLLLNGQPVALTTRQHDLLLELVSHPGKIVTKSRLMEVGWRDVVVTENNLVQAIKQLRQLLDASDPDKYITTVARLGYKFVAPVTEDIERATDSELDDMLAPHRALMDGRALLETLERPRIARALAVFEALVLRDGRRATFHVGLANACVLRYESTRADALPDVRALERAATHAREACRLDPDYGEAWATLGFVLERTGARRDALAALRQAVSLEPNSWQHHLRHAYGSWGDERLRSARRTLELFPGLPWAHLLAASVFVARDALGLAERELVAALAALPDPSSPSSRMPIVALNWLHGLLCLARGDIEGALAAFERELALERREHLYARECCASVWYAKGACALRRGDHDDARNAFGEAIARVPGHPMAHAGLALVNGPRSDAAAGMLGNGDAPSQPMAVDAAMARAAVLVAHGDATGAAALVSAALDAAPPGNAGWLLPIDPLLAVYRDTAPWVGALATLRARAGVWLTPSDE